VEQMTEWTPHRLALTPGERRELLRLVKRGQSDGNAKVIEALLPTDDNGVYDFVPGPFVGRFALQSGRVLDIRSRLIPADELPDVLRIAGHLPARLDETATPAQQGWGIVDVLALALASEAEKIIGHGIAKGYQQRRFRSPPLPGTIDICEHLTRYAARPDKLTTVARRLTSDIDRNQALATALLLRLPLQPLARMRLRRVSAALSAVSAPPMSAQAVEKLIGAHRQIRYDPALRLAAIVFRGSTIAAAGAGLVGTSVLFSMPDVWEDFVLAWVRLCHHYNDVHAQYTFPLLNGRSTPVAAADVVVLNNLDNPSVLYDAKYKAAGAVPSADDIYQMVTYCERLGLSEAILVHPGRGEPTAISLGQRRIRTVQLNLDARSGWVDRAPGPMRQHAMTAAGAIDHERASVIMLCPNPAVLPIVVQCSGPPSSWSWPVPVLFLDGGYRLWNDSGVCLRRHVEHEQPHSFADHPCEQFGVAV
jgi:5-methylcytosine-specific restriction enzyme subunit McrC